MENKEKIKYTLFIILYIACVFYMTLFSRTRYLSQNTHLEPLWSYIDWLKGNKVRGRSIFLNIALFIPVGYLLPLVFSLHFHWRIKTILSCLHLSLFIEIVQFITGRGVFDIDDLISNTVGGSLGILLYEFCVFISIRKYIAAILVFVGLTGCIIIAKNSGEPEPAMLERQFYFNINSLTMNNELEVNGQCKIYGKNALPFEVLLVNTDTTLKAETTINEDHFSSSLDGGLSGKYEVYIRFKGFHSMPTGVYIDVESLSVEYVPKTVVPDIEDLSLLSEWKLMAFNSEYDVFIYQKNGTLRWMIGTHIDENTEIIYQIYTNEQEKLPINRKQFGFDNRGFHIGSTNDKGEIERYRVFDAKIPSEYNVTAVVVGFNTDGRVTWTDSFRVEH